MSAATAVDRAILTCLRRLKFLQVYGFALKRIPLMLIDGAVAL